MSAYDNDPRVENFQGRGNLYRVSRHPGEDPVARVRRFLDSDSWAVWPGGTGPAEPEWQEWQEFPTADEAIRSLIGDPQ